MAIRCGFFNSVNEDRKYSAADMNQAYIGLVSNGVIPNRVEEAEEDQTSLAVYSNTGADVRITAGRGIFSDKWFLLDADMSIPLPTNNTLSNQYASIIVRIDNRAAYRSAEILLIQAVDKTQIPAINTIDNVDEYRLANITIKTGSTPTTQADIEDTRMTDECGFCHGLIRQLSTEDIFRQWQALFDDWFENIQISLTTEATLVTALTSNYTTSGTETIIPINIAQYNNNLDILRVYINGLELIKNKDYSVNGNTNITLVKSVYAGTIISFTVLKSINGSQASTIVQEFQQLQQIVNAIKPQVDNLVIDTGWINFTLERGTAVAGMSPAVRRVGNVVYLRGALSGITTTTQTTQVTICTLPENCAPAMEHYFTQLVGGTGASVGYTNVRFKVNRNRASGGNATIVINGSSGTININQTIPISTCFVIG